MEKIIAYGFFLLFLSSCWKEEIPVEEFDRGDVREFTMAVGENYGNQVWFDLETEQVVKTGAKEIWDISLKIENGLLVVRQNTSLSSSAYTTEIADWNSVTQVPSGAVFRYDESSGGTDSLAIGVIHDFSKIWIIDRGYDAMGQMQGKLKFRILSFSGNEVQLEHSALNGTNHTTATVYVEESYNCTGYSFVTGERILHEPEDTAWDLCFTQYTHMFYDPYQPYLVVGVLANGGQVEVAEWNDADFEAISGEDAAGMVYSGRVDEIGYDWKVYNFDTQLYHVDSRKVYILRTAQDVVYKLRFIDFYNSSGVRGFPRFEMQMI